MVCNQPERCHLDIHIYCIQGTVDERCSLKKELGCQVQAIGRNSSGICENFVTMTGVTTEHKRGIWARCR